MKLRTIVANSLLVLVSLAVAVTLAEITCRFLPVTNDTDPTYKLAHPVLPYAMKPNSEAVTLFGRTITINSHGLRDREFSVQKPASAFRILVLGDSVVFGYGQEARDTFPKILEAQLDAVPGKRYERIEVINAGHSGFNILDEYDYLRLYGMQFSPDVLIVGLNNNDFTTQSMKVVIRDGVDSAPGSLWVQLNVPGWVKKTLRKSHLYLAIGNAFRYGLFRLEGPSVELSQDEVETRLRATGEHLGKVIALASSRGLPLYLVSLPDRDECRSGAYKFPAFVAQVQTLANEGKLTFVDTLPDFRRHAARGEELYPQTDGAHTNARGHGIIARRLFEQLAHRVR